MEYNTHTPAHAYLFCGADSVVLQNKAADFIFNAVCGSGYEGNEQLLRERILDNSFSDVMRIDNDGGSIKIEEIRKAQSFSELMPTECGCKFIVINNAENLTVQAQNAMLKTLEDIMENRYILLLAPSSDNLIPTVLSRLQTIKFNGEADAALSVETQSVIVNMLEDMLLAGNIATMFNLCDFIIKDKSAILANLYYFYCLFGQIISYNQRVTDKLEPSLRLLAENVSMVCARRAAEHIKKAMDEIKRNASPVITTEVMLINIREDYNAENSRCQI